MITMVLHAGINTRIHRCFCNLEVSLVAGNIIILLCTSITTNLLLSDNTGVGYDVLLLPARFNQLLVIVFILAPGLCWMVDLSMTLEALGIDE